MVETILGYVWVAAVVILLFGLAIFVHELGHFLAARRLGLVVDTFSLGFGPALWKREIGGVLYKICVFPLGGYVALPQLDPSGMEKVQGSPDDGKEKGEDIPPRELPPVAAWRRIVVSIAGPLGNVVLAVVLAWVIYLAPHAATGGANTQVGTVREDSPAWQAGLRPGQTIERVNGERVNTWYDFLVECHLAGDPRHGVVLTVRDADRVRDLRVQLATNLIPDVNVVEGISPRSLCRIDGVVSNSVASANDIRAGDHLRMVNGIAVLSSGQFVDFLAKNGTNAVRLELVRNQQILTRTIAPRWDAEASRPLIGVRLSDAFADVPFWMQYSKPGRQVLADAGQVVRILKALIFPQNKGESKRAAQAIGGPPMIIVALWHAVQAGLLSSLGFLRMLCINLAIINLLPLPVLDGGHVVFALWEVVTRRKPHPKVVSVLVNAFAVLLIGMMVLLIGRDFLRMHKQRRQSGAEETPRPSVHAPATAGATNAPSGAAAP